MTALAEPFPALYVAKCVGLLSTGLAAGFSISNHHRIEPLFVNPLDPFQAGASPYTLSITDRLAIWHTQYNSGAKTAIPLIAVSAASLAIVGQLTTNLTTTYGVGGPGWYRIAALVSASIAPFTLTFIAPINNQLIAMRKKPEAKERDVEDIFKTWRLLHAVRSTAFLVSFCMTVVGVLH